MTHTLPGTTVEVRAFSRGVSKQLFDGLFAAGGITLSQILVMTGMEPYLIQNWVKRGFLTSPKKRMYSQDQFARILIINMLRESLQIEKICSLITIIGGDLHDDSDNLIHDAELYHRYVDMLSEGELLEKDPERLREAATRAAEDFVEPIPGAKKKLVDILQIMLYAHAAAQLCREADDMISALQ